MQYVKFMIKHDNTRTKGAMHLGKLVESNSTTTYESTPPENTIQINRSRASKEDVFDKFFQKIRKIHFLITSYYELTIF